MVLIRWKFARDMAMNGTKGIETSITLPITAFFLKSKRLCCEKWTSKVVTQVMQSYSIHARLILERLGFFPRIDKNSVSSAKLLFTSANDETAKLPKPARNTRKLRIN